LTSPAQLLLDNHRELSRFAMQLFIRSKSKARSSLNSYLDPAQAAGFFDKGYLVLPKLFTDEEVAAINAAVDRAWADRSIYNNLTISAYAGTERYTETYLRYVDLDARNSRYKLNHLYLYDPRVFHLLYSEKLYGVLAELLQDKPVVFNGLNMEQGTEQPMHLDTFYMPPRAPNQMVATWIALEDIHPDSGPLNYVPKSHHIPPYRFSHGEIWAKQDELPAFYAYIDRELSDRRMAVETFCPKKGDVFIWHAQLYHGGGVINNRSLSRRSMVNHFWTYSDYRDDVVEVRQGKFMLRQDRMFVASNFLARPAV